MTRSLIALVLTLSSLSIDAAPRRRAVLPPPAAVVPEAIANAARQKAEATLATGVPAVQAAVSKRGEIIYSGAFGLSDRESATAATPRSVMQTGSIMKQFASAAILQLAERGALTLEDRIEKHVTDFNPKGATITLRHLLTHTSGVAANPNNEYAPLTRQQFMALVNAAPLAFAPGSQWSYSNSGYRLLGYAIESITGLPFAEVIHREFAVPLGLIDTGVCGTNNLPTPDGYAVSQGTVSRIEAIHMSVPFSAGALCSTANDLVRWAHLLATGRVVQPASYAAMTTPVQLNNKSFAPYGLGLSISNQAGRPAIWHTGGIPGFHTSLVYFPDSEIAVSVILNALPGPPGVSAHFIALEIANAALASQ